MLSEQDAIKYILEGTAKETGQQFFNCLASTMSQALGYSDAWITERESRYVLKTIALYRDNQLVKNRIYDYRNTPCETVIEKQVMVEFEDQVQSLYPKDLLLAEWGARSYIGIPMLSSKGDVLGHLALLDKKPVPKNPDSSTILRIFASRAGAELERILVERDLQARKEETQLVLDTAMDCIVTLDSMLNVLSTNQAVRNQFKGLEDDIIGKRFTSFIDARSVHRFENLVNLLLSKDNNENHLWLPAGILLNKPNGDQINADITLSVIERNKNTNIVLSFRDINDRVESQKRIELLDREREYFKEELEKASGTSPIIGSSPVMKEVLEDIEQVASTNATVLIVGETGTGKELVANALHAQSKRRDSPFIKVNCAALHTELIESEFFGHEKGAFSGATSKRIGRFQLADGGTIFLDEIGDIPADVQVKLLRVLQEGEFEPVGSSATLKVDVRVIAATHRDLQQAVQEGRFREDLYYRLNVFPLSVPPLRERGDDIVAIARKFKDYFCKELGRNVPDFTEQHEAMLKSYSWPGNIRELRNVIERAVIISKHYLLNLERAMPMTEADSIPMPSPESAQPMADEMPSDGAKQAMSFDGSTIFNEVQLKDLERENILRALEACNGKISGDRGAAKLLGLKPSTLTSRMKTHEIGIEKS